MKLGDLFLAFLDLSPDTTVLLYDSLGAWEDDDWFLKGCVDYALQNFRTWRVVCFSCVMIPDGGVETIHVCLEVKTR